MNWAGVGPVPLWQTWVSSQLSCPAPRSAVRGSTGGHAGRSGGGLSLRGSKERGHWGVLH